MRLNEISYSDTLPIDGYGPGFFRIGGQVHEGALMVLPTGVFHWKGYGDVEKLRATCADVDVVFIGTGAEIAHVPAEFRAALEEAGIGVEVMNSPAACRTYNILLSEGRRVALALVPV